MSCRHWLLVPFIHCTEKQKPNINLVHFLSPTESPKWGLTDAKVSQNLITVEQRFIQLTFIHVTTGSIHIHGLLNLCICRRLLFSFVS